MKFVVMSICVLLVMPLSAYALPYRPQLQGYGTDTTGGRGGTICRVQNLNNSGANSLRWALDGTCSTGARIVVLEVSGRIHLSTATFATNDTIKLCSVGSTHTVYKNDSAITSFTDSSLSGGAPGVTSFHTAVIDDWTATDEGLSARPCMLSLLGVGVC